MTVKDLMQLLEGFDPDAEVRLAQQPSWPFEYSVGEVVEVDPASADGYHVRHLTAAEAADLGFDERDAWYAWFSDMHDVDWADGPFETEAKARDAVDEHVAKMTNADGPVVYVGEGTQLDYLPGAARRELGWS